MFRGCLMFVFTLVFTSIFALAAGYFVYTQFAMKKTVIMPSLLRMPYDEAMEKLNDADLKVAIERRKDPNAPEGTVVYQNVAPLVEVKKGRTIILHVAEPLEKTTLPDLRGIEEREATFKLSAEKLPVGNISRTHHASVEEGRIIATSPPFGAEVARGTTVDLLVSQGPAPLAYVMPDVIGMTKSSAQSQFEKLPNEVGLKNTGPGDRVVAQSPPPGGKLKKEDRIELSIGAP
ncbi:MAG: PASTA domain-containing protein [Candidatus Omnitrophica bacterium]|nr:Serine/threonine-protein kinase PK-1 [bacterium]NUN94901.1 PASTA domain-containing protein [Candidatus Omnitrophota bacterium]